MARVGFIHDKLDIKFLILYIMSRVAAPTFTLRLALDDEHGNLLTVDMLAATEQQCDRLSEQFKAHPEQIYNGILDVLLTDYEEKE